MRRLALLFALGSAVLLPARADAWIFHEHYLISKRGMLELPAGEYEQIVRLWTEMRAGHEDRLCEQPSDLELREKRDVTCVDFAAFAPIAGDHSCRPGEMLRFSLEEKWLLKVVRTAYHLMVDLSKETDARDRIDRWNFSNLVFQRVDPYYATRAGGNFAHFSMWRDSLDLATYMKDSTKVGQTINATYLYPAYHLAALRFAVEYAKESEPERKKALLEKAMSAESYALHFLEDAFAAGHVVGQWGGAAIAKGTHDYYCIHGIPAITWQRDSYGAKGDAHMEQRDLERAARAVRSSLSHFLRAVRGEPLPEIANVPIELAETLASIDSCKAEEVEHALPEAGLVASTTVAWNQTIQPSTGPKQIHLPRFRSEIGLYAGFTGSAAFNAGFGGFDSPNASPRPGATLDFYFNFGMGLEGAVGRGADGGILLGVGLMGTSPQYDTCIDCEGKRAIGQNIARVPGRLGASFRLRMPFWLIPGDLLIAAPFILPFSFDTYSTMAVIAASGGIIPWQRVLFSRIGDFQFIAGREIRVAPLGNSGQDTFIRTEETEEPVAIKFRSIWIDVPLIEYRPFRLFSQSLTGTFVVQFGGAIDIPYHEERVANEAEEDIESSYLLYLRLQFDGRLFF